MSQHDLLGKVRTIFSEYLLLHKQRKTTERFAVLEAIYSRNDHCDADSLYHELRKKKLNVSRATVYNTLDLLQGCGLVKKQQFGNNLALFEKAFGYRQHDHLICMECGKVLEFCDPRIQEISSRMGQLFNFSIDHHSLMLYGHCGGCGAKPSTRLQHEIVN
jgi:Fur family transcriptional regulator, ferric uptake regulator